MSSKTKWAGLLAALLLLPGHALANMGVPIFANTVMGIVLWIIPIVIVEALILRKQIRISAIDAAWSVTVGNIASTVAGIGLVILVIIADIPLLSDYVGYGKSSYLLSLAILVPLFFLSVAIELPVVGKILGSVDRHSLKRAIFLANIGSYLMMSTFLIARVIKLVVLSST